MKKFYILLTILVSAFILNSSVSAKIEMTNLVEAVDEEIEYFSNPANFPSVDNFEAYQDYVKLMENADLTNYSESDNKITIYIFRGDSCWHCLDAVSWLADKYADYGELFNVHTYEVWKNSSNSNLMKTVAKLLKDNASGVPYIVIGNKSYAGFSEELGFQMLQQIQEDLKSEERYDIKDYINFEDGTLLNTESKSKTSIIIAILIVIVGGAVLIYYVSKSK